MQYDVSDCAWPITDENLHWLSPCLGGWELFDYPPHTYRSRTALKHRLESFTAMELMPSLPWWLPELWRAAARNR
jgi:hypothetical protein